MSGAQTPRALPHDLALALLLAAAALVAAALSVCSPADTPPLGPDPACSSPKPSEAP